MITTGGADKTVIIWKTDWGNDTQPPPPQDAGEEFEEFGEVEEDEGDQSLPDNILADVGISKS